MPITPEMLQNMGGGTQAVQPNRTAYADMIMKQLAQIGQPAIGKSTSTSTLEGGGQGMDLGTLAMMLFYMLNRQKQSGQTGVEGLGDDLFLGDIGGSPSYYDIAGTAFK